MEIYATIVGIIKAIPILDGWFKNIYATYIQLQYNNIDSNVQQRKEEMEFVVSKMKGAQSEEERRVYFRLLVRINS